jgi:hypothetical protein
MLIEKEVITLDKKAQRKEIQKRYKNSDKGRAAYAKLKEAGKLKEYADKYRKSDSRKVAISKYEKSDKGIKGRRRRHQRLREIAIEKYSNGTSCCMCECGCRESKLIYLDLDHVNGDGAAHRRLLFGNRNQAGHSFYVRLKKLGWPNDPPLRVLCVKCNVGRQRNGGRCPELPENQDVD